MWLTSAALQFENQSMGLGEDHDTDSFGGLREPPLLERSASFAGPSTAATPRSQTQASADAAVAAIRKEMAVSAANLVVLAARKHAKEQTLNEMEWVVDVGVIRATSASDGVSSMLTSDQVCMKDCVFPCVSCTTAEGRHSYQVDRWPHTTCEQHGVLFMGTA